MYIPVLDETVIDPLGYADDFTLLASSQEDLQVLIDATQEWCTAMNMKLNGSKTQVLNINPDATPSSITVLCDGKPIEVVEEAKYLGLHVHNKSGLGASIARLEQRFWMAWANLIKGYSNFECDVSMSLMLDLYLACLPPLISYGCEVWAFRTFKGTSKSSTRPCGSKLLDAHRRCSVRSPVFVRIPQKIFSTVS